MRCSVGIIDEPLTIDDLYRTACAPLALISMFARFGDLSSTIMVVPWRGKVSRGGGWFFSLFSDRNVSAIR